MKNNKFAWEKDGQKGCTWLYHHGLVSTGYIERNGELESFTTVSEDAKYNLTYLSGGNTIPLALHIGTRCNPDTGGYLLYGALYYNRKLVIENYHSKDGINIDINAADNGFFKTSLADNKLHANIQIGNILWVLGEETIHDMIDENFNVWSMDLTLTTDFSAMSGKVTEQTTKAGITKAGTVYNIQGNAQTENALIAAKKRTEAPISNALMSFQSSIQDAPKSITELYTLPAPDMKDANTEASKTLFYLMVYHVADKKFKVNGAEIYWSNWFGINKDKARDMVVNMNSAILELVDGAAANEDVKNFLVDYAKGSLGNSYASSEDEDIKSYLSDAKKRLNGQCSVSDLCSYYMQGDSQTSLGKNKGFIIAMECINRYVYAKKTPGLLKYINDKSYNWAFALYKQCLATLPQLQIEALSGASNEVSHKTMMLNILDDKKHDNIIQGTDGKPLSMTYGSVIYAKVFNMQLSKIADALGIGFTGDSSDPDFIKMMREIFSIMWDEIQKDVSDYFSPDILKALRKEREKYADLTKELFIQETIDITLTSMNMIKAGSTIAALLPKIGQLSGKPWAAYTGTVCGILFYAISVGSLATIFMSWDKASTAEKIEAVLMCIQGVASISVSVIKIFTIRTLVNPESSIADKMNAVLRLRMDSEDMSTIKALASVGGTDIDEQMMNTAKKFSIDANNGNTKVIVSKFTKFFRVMEISVRILGIALIGFATVTTAIELANAVKTGGYNASIYLEIMSTSIMAICFIIEGVSLALDIIGITCSAIPIIGAVCALVGIIFQVIAMALQKPINPIELYIKGEVVPFLNSLDIPSMEWADKRKNNSLYTAKMNFVLA